MPNAADFNRFSGNPVSMDISRSLFNMDHTVKFSCDIGECIPFAWYDCQPSDTFSIDTTRVVRLQPLVAPIMDEVVQDVYWFFVPYRLVWSHLKQFFGENDSAPWAPTIDYEIPQLTIPSGGFNAGTIADYLGVPINTGAGETINALPFRAYALIMSEWFRSEALQNPVHVYTDDTTRTGVNTGDQVTDIELGGKPFIACKLHDVFTSALPQPQRGDPVNVSLAGLAPVVPTDRSVLAIGKTYDKNNSVPTPHGLMWNSFRYNSATDDFTTVKPTNAHDFPLYANKESNETIIYTSGTTVDVNPTNYYYPSNLWADLGNASQFSINDLRIAFAMQKYLERSARSGGRYIEFVRAFFNCDSPDARLQRPEYLGGSRLPLNVQQVEQHSATASEPTPLGNVAGLSLSGDFNSDVNFSVTEHGLIMGITVARYNHSYQQGLEPKFLRKTKWEFYNPVFANIGEMPIKNASIYLEDNSANDHNDETFGFQEAWFDYRYIPNRIAGQMRSQYSQPLDMWHLGDNYASLPYLGSSWIREDKTNLDRCLAVTSAVSNQMICDFLIKVKAARPMPLYSVPGLIDHH